MKRGCILLVLVFGMACNSKHGPVKVNAESTAEKPFLRTKEQIDNKSITPPLLGFNGTNFSIHMNQQLEAELRDFSPSFIRFPGGTVANGYYPKGNGYGNSVSAKMVEKGVGKHLEKARKKARGMKENIRVAVAKFCKNQQVPVLYVANVWDGTPQEVLENLSYFKSNGVEIIGVELGNEYYLQAYRHRFPTAMEYIEACAPFVKELKSRYPNIPISWVAAPSPSLKRTGNTTFFKDWNEQLSLEPLVQNISVHYYPNPISCEAKDEACLKTFLSKEQAEWKAGFYELNETFQGKGIWVSEWNIKHGTRYGGGTFHHEFINAFMFDVVQLKSEGIPIHLLCYHNLVGGEGSVGNALFSVQSDSVQTLRVKDFFDWYGEWAVEDATVTFFGNHQEVLRINDSLYWTGKPYANICNDPVVLQNTEAWNRCQENSNVKYLKVTSYE